MITVHHPKRMFDLTEGLIRRGYNDRDIALIIGGNAVRVLSEIWSARSRYGDLVGRLRPRCARDT